MAASIWNVYDQALLKLGKKTLDLTADTFKCALFTSASNVGSNSLATATYSAATNELTTASGYTVGGVTLASVTYTNASGTEKFTSADISWTPVGTGIICRFAVIYDSTTGDLICWMYPDSTPSDVSLNTITISGSGIFTLARA